MVTDDRLNRYFDKVLTPGDCKPYAIMLYLKTPAILYDPLHLDGLLAKALVENALEGESLPDSADPYWLPLPLKQAWTAENGLPLWCTTDFEPLDTDSIDSEFWHKRTIDPAFLPKTRAGKPFNIRATQGALKEYRIPLPRHACLTWQATFEGDANAVATLLTSIASIGKKRAHGHGVVDRWEIRSIPEFSFFGADREPKTPHPYRIFARIPSQCC